jgi:nitrite reductase/ring-hydroxylating ferredoxin subunit
MKRAQGLHEFSRRDFCAFACLGAAGATFAACFSDGTGAVGTGGLNGSDGNNSVDASNVTHPDASGSGSGSGSGSAATCSGTYVDVGAPTTFTMNVPKLVSGSSVFIVRDANGLYALSSKCTHQGVSLTAQSTRFYCSAHGATFSLVGAVTGGPTSKALQHYSLCTLANGNVGLQTSIKVDASTRLNV